MRKLGFGCMRLPMKEENTAVDYDQFNQMIDAYMAEGFNYFDTLIKTKNLYFIYALSFFA